MMPSKYNLCSNKFVRLNKANDVSLRDKSLPLDIKGSRNNNSVDCSCQERTNLSGCWLIRGLSLLQLTTLMTIVTRSIRGRPLKLTAASISGTRPAG